MQHKLNRAVLGRDHDTALAYHRVSRVGGLARHGNKRAVRRHSERKRRLIDLIPFGRLGLGKRVYSLAVGDQEPLVKIGHSVGIGRHAALSRSVRERSRKDEACVLQLFQRVEG